MRALPFLLIVAPLFVVACGQDDDGNGGSGPGSTSATTTTSGSTASHASSVAATSSVTATASASASSSGAGGADCVAPSDGLWATFQVVGDTYRAQITNPQGITQAIDLWQGNATAAIPNGALVCTPADYNCGHAFHQDPATIQFADVTIEVCDGTPSYVDANCATFGTNYCPWSAVLIELRDCRTDPACPLVPNS